MVRHPDCGHDFPDAGCGTRAYRAIDRRCDGRAVGVWRCTACRCSVVAARWGPVRANYRRAAPCQLVRVWHIASFRKSCCGKDKGILLMQIWPAIDLRGGKCVRLRQGDYRQETVFGDDPAAMAVRWVDAGARQLHLVDLDGARDGSLANRAAIAAILERGPGSLSARWWDSRRSDDDRPVGPGVAAAGDRHAGAETSGVVSGDVPEVSRTGSWSASMRATGAWRPTAGWRRARWRRRPWPGSWRRNRLRGLSTRTLRRTG